ncbi:hypothetical protein ACET3Z_012658 [Daucus carota]
MSFSKFNTFDELDPLSTDWCIRVRAQSIWKGINLKTNEFRGLNVVFLDDTNARIHAFIAPLLCSKIEKILNEGGIYKIKFFQVKTYNGDETHKAVRNPTHIYFTQDTTVCPDTDTELPIERQSFDFFVLSDVEKFRKDNRFLIDVVGVLEDSPTKIPYKKDNVEKFNVKFTITDGRCSVNVTFFNELGDCFLNALAKEKETPVIVILASAKINEWKDEVGLTNSPATRFYLNSTHQSAKKLRQREKDPSFYKFDIDEEEEKEIPTFTIKEILNLKEDYLEKEVQCTVLLKKVEQHLNWYYKLCTVCDMELDFEDKKNQCPKCKKLHPYPDRRFRLYTLCSDSTGTVPVMLPNELVIQLCGKTVYDVAADENEVGDGDKFPQILTQLQKKTYNLTLYMSKENIKEGSHVYMASRISGPHEISATSSPTAKTSMDIKQTDISSGKTNSNNSPPTKHSSTKSRARKSSAVVQCAIPLNNPPTKTRNMKPDGVCDSTLNNSINMNSMLLSKVDAPFADLIPMA